MSKDSDVKTKQDAWNIAKIRSRFLSAANGHADEIRVFAAAEIFYDELMRADAKNLEDAVIILREVHKLRAAKKSAPSPIISPVTGQPAR